MTKVNSHFVKLFLFLLVTGETIRLATKREIFEKSGRKRKLCNSSRLFIVEVAFVSFLKWEG